MSAPAIFAGLSSSSRPDSTDITHSDLCRPRKSQLYDIKQGTTSMTGADLASMLPDMLPRLWAFALRISGDQHDAEDLVQRACVRALERAHQLRPGTAPLSWMFSIVQSTWINEQRARNVRSRFGVDWDHERLETIADLSAATPEQHAMHSQIVGAVQQLPEAQRVVMLLVGVEGLSYNEAAKALDVPIGTIMSRLSRARRAIGALFKDDIKKAGWQ
jgi:RNA polymerase sigma-70 factor (ECF subfamily)